MGAANLITLTNLTGNGANPAAGLIADASGNLFGTATYGGAAGYGTVFELAKGSSGYTLSTLVDFTADNGANPAAGLIADANGDLFGTTQTGGANGDGTVFELVKGSSGYRLTTLVSFSGSNGAGPPAGLIADANGDLFGTTPGGGTDGVGTVFELVKGGSGYTLNTLVSFSDTNGSYPYGGLIADAHGNLFGTTAWGGVNGSGTVFELMKGSSGYTFTTLVSFSGSNGAGSAAGLIADANGNLFGTTPSGGTDGVGTVFELAKGSSGYTLNTLVSFSRSNGANPWAGLIADANGNLFGTTKNGGANGDGTVFELAKGSNGYTLSTLVDFNGAQSSAGLIADANGDLFGTTQNGGTNGDGTVFEVTNGGFSPTAPTLTAALLHDTGISASDGITSDPTITGTGDPNATVTVSEGNIILGTTTADAQGHWTFTPAGLAQGAHTLTATETNAAGLTGSAQVSLTLDTTAISDTLFQPNDTPAVSGNDGHKIELGLQFTSSTSGVITGLRFNKSNLDTSTTHIGDLWDSSGNLLGRVTFSNETASGWQDASFATPIAISAGQIYVASYITPTGYSSLTQHYFDSPHIAGVLSATEGVFEANGDETLPTNSTLNSNYWVDTDFTPPPTLTAALLHDTGISVSDGITSDPAITGTGDPNAMVTVSEGKTNLGTTTADAQGHWTFTPTGLTQGARTLTATETDTAGNIGSAKVSLTLDTMAPAVTARAVDNPADPVTRVQVLAGTGDPNATVTLREYGHIIGTAQAGSDGNWTYDPSSLAPGAHALTATEIDAAGNTGITPAVSLTVPEPRFDLVDGTALTSGAFYGSDYTGPVGYLQAECGYTGDDNVVIGGRVANVFLHSGAGEDALAAKAGSNVLDGGAGSNWLVGADGSDGGADTFFVDGRGGQHTWDTLLNFHPGDMVTLWGYDASSGSLSWSDDMGATGHQGATLHAQLGGGSGSDALVTFAGLTTEGAKFAASTGTTGGISYLAVACTAV
ncbi:MAG: DUF4082 domain-containing protein [Acetobacteraceae bacterium]|nr:DUF4082 domain-containing protein [Acetobacteraceae bacterium]